MEFAKSIKSLFVPTVLDGTQIIYVFMSGHVVVVIKSSDKNKVTHSLYLENRNYGSKEKFKK